MPANSDKSTEKQRVKSDKPRGKPFAKGVSGNPGGRPRGKTVLTLVREMLYERGNGKELEEIAKSFITCMAKGSFQHLKEFIDRESGKVPDRVANADGSNLDGFDENRLTLEELIVLRNLQRKAAVRPPAFGSGDLPA